MSVLASEGGVAGLAEGQDSSRSLPVCAGGERGVAPGFVVSPEEELPVPSEKALVLSALEKQVLQLHLNGYPPQQVGELLGISTRAVSSLLLQGDIQELLGKVSELQTLELAALTGPAIDAVRRQLAKDGAVSLKAADMVLKTQGLYKAPEGGSETAEDVVKRILEVVASDGTEIRYAEERSAGRAKSLNGGSNSHSHEEREVA